MAAVVRPGHPLLNVAGLSLKTVESKPWIVPPQGNGDFYVYSNDQARGLDIFKFDGEKKK